MKSYKEGIIWLIKQLIGLIKIVGFGNKND